MTTLEHKKYGALGSEFIVHHCTYKPKRLVLSLLVTSALAATFQMYETDIMVLWMMSLCLAALLMYRLLYKVSKEAVLVLPSVGVQVKTQYWLGGLETQFFDRSHVRGIVINEAVTMHSVLCYLAVLLTSASTAHTQHIVPLFPQSWPGQKDLVYIYQTVENMHLDRPQTSPPPSSSSLPSSPSSSSPLPPRQQDGERPGTTGRITHVKQMGSATHGQQSRAVRSRRRTRSSQS